MAKKKRPKGYDPLWAKAKKLCRLNQEDIRKAKELGFKPRSLMKNIPSKDEKWKAPVKYWIRDLYEKRQEKAAKKARRKAKAAEQKNAEAAAPPPHPPEEPEAQPEYDDEVPF